MGSLEPLTASPCRGDGLCQAGQSCLPARGTLLSWSGGIWGSLRAGSVHGGVRTAGGGVGGCAREEEAEAGVHEWVHPRSCACRRWVLGRAHL